MQLNVSGKNLEVTDSLREYVEKKIGRLDRYLPTITDARVELSVENTRAAKDRQVAQVTLRTKQHDLASGRSVVGHVRLDRHCPRQNSATDRSL